MCVRVTGIGWLCVRGEEWWIRGEMANEYECNEREKKIWQKGLLALPGRPTRVTDALPRSKAMDGWIGLNSDMPQSKAEGGPKRKGVPNGFFFSSSLHFFFPTIFPTHFLFLSTQKIQLKNFPFGERTKVKDLVAIFGSCRPIYLLKTWTRRERVTSARNRYCCRGCLWSSNSNLPRQTPNESREMAR